MSPSAFAPSPEVSRAPSVAVVMAVIDRDRAPWVRAAMDSLLSQGHAPLDVHVMLSGALPGDLAGLLRSYADRDGRVRLHASAERRPLGTNLNALLDHARGYDYVARMDADDESLPDRIAKQVRFMEAHPAADLLGGAIIDIDDQGRELKRVRYPLEHAEIVRFFERRTPVAHPTVMFRPTFFAKAGPYPARPLEDGLYWMRGILAGCVFANLPDALVRVRRSEEMLRRRSGWRTNWEELKIRVTINRALGFGPAAYAWGLVTFAAQMMPIPVKRILYDRLR